MRTLIETTGTVKSLVEAQNGRVARLEATVAAAGAVDASIELSVRDHQKRLEVLEKDRERVRGMLLLASAVGTSPIWWGLIKVLVTQ